ncbi:MAG: GNAT family N-acetyltransferase [Caldilineaceae bacterium]|nr:GNAT family N-acetyltransferase [Caldilineaceae bacterium]
MTRTLPAGMTARPPTRDDVGAVVALINAAQVAEGDEPDMTVTELRKDWVDADLDDEAILLLDADGAPVAMADILNRRYRQINVYAFVPPGPAWDARWDYLTAWGEQWAAGHAHLGEDVQEVAVHRFIRATNTRAIAHLEADGYVNVRTHYVMRATLDTPPPAPVWPDGIGIRTYRGPEDDDALFAAGEEAFSDMWNRPPSTKERWLQGSKADGFDPTLWFLPYDLNSGDVVGVCLCFNLEGVGDVENVGVRRAWRKRGIGLAMLNHALGEFHRRGIRAADLSVDAASPTGAPRLYARAGFEVTRSYRRFEKRIVKRDA